MRSVLILAIALNLSACDCQRITNEPSQTDTAEFDPSDLASLPNFQFRMPGEPRFTVDPYIAAAIRLQEMGREDACEELLNNAKYTYQMVVLCRMLFVARDPWPFRSPGLGVPHYLLGGTDVKDWPLVPVEIVDGVPFIVARGYMLQGLGENGESYLKWCIENCDWNTFRFRKLTLEEKNAAMAKLLASEKLKYRSDGDARTWLSAQIK